MYTQVVYSLGGLTAQRHGDLFAVNSSSGELYVRGQIDYEMSSVYYLSVVAADRGGSGGGTSGRDSRSSSASVTVDAVVYLLPGRQFADPVKRRKVKGGDIGQR